MISTVMKGHRVHKILMDNGNSLNILLAKVMTMIGIARHLHDDYSANTPYWDGRITSTCEGGSGVDNHYGDCASL
jgi:hypothetical protein